MTRTEHVDMTVKGGLVVLPDGCEQVGVAIDHGTIVAIAADDELPSADREIDATGTVVLPGAIDVHMHYDRDGRVADDVRDATLAAAYGGVTSLVHFLHPEDGRSAADTVDSAVEEIKAESYLDVGFHLYLRSNDFAALDEIPSLITRGITSYKMAMAYKRRGMMSADEFLIAAMDAIGRNGGVAMVHAESGETIDYLEERMKREGRKSPGEYALSRPDYAEAEAIVRATAYARATCCQLYVVHLSSAAALRQLLMARRSGCDVLAETCPQYLALTNDAMSNFGNLAKIAPPLRTSADQDALWEALADGQLSLVASDHAPYPLSQKLAEPENVYASPFGAPTVETMLAVLHSEGVVKRGLGLPWLARVTSEMPARVFGLHPRKGGIRIGADADLCLLDANETRTVAATGLHSKAGYTPFEGMTVKGWARTTIAGDVVVHDGEVEATPGNKRFLPRKPMSDRLTDLLKTGGY